MEFAGAFGGGGGYDFGSNQLSASSGGGSNYGGTYRSNVGGDGMSTVMILVIAVAVVAVFFVIKKV